MKTTTNKDMLNAIRNQASAEYQERIPAVVDAHTVREVERALEAYPTAKNEFIKTLTDKVVKTEFFSKVYSNPLKQLKKGMLPYGSSIEELFVAAAEAKGFYNSGEGSGLDDAAALVGTKKGDVKALYIERNFAYVFKVSISDAQLKSAFITENGLSNLVNQLVGSLTSGAERKEYVDMINTLKAAAAGRHLIMDTCGEYKGAAIKKGHGETGVQQGMKVVEVTNEAKAITKEVRALAGRLKFMSKDYNMAKVETFTNPEDLVLLTTPEVMADLDVNVIASAFNVSAADMNVRTILVDSLPTHFKAEINGEESGEEEKKCLAILMDKDFIQSIDTVNESRQFENGRNLTTNVFLHKQGIMANCYFANCIALVAAE